jgi:hypothetical protein
MMKSAKFCSVLSLLGLLLLLATGATAADEHKDKKKTNHGATIKAMLTGAAESPGPGDPDGSGEVAMKVEMGQKQLCFDVKVANIDAPTAGHVHKGAAGQSGPAVVVLSQVMADGAWKNCVSADAQLIGDIQRNPEGYYFNVHNAAYPDGAVRGQFTRAAGVNR